MWDVTELLIDEERLLGSYTIEIVRKIESGWNPTVPPLYAVVTNFRLILKPQVRKSYDPASIPGNYIIKATALDIGRHKGIQLELSTGHHLYIIIPQRDSENIIDDIRTMLGPKPRFRFDDKVAAEDIRRLVEYFAHAPTHPLD